MFYFHKVEYVQYLGEVDIFQTWVKTISSSLKQCKNYKNRSRFSKVMINKVLPPFLWFTVYVYVTVKVWNRYRYSYVRV